MQTLKLQLNTPAQITQDLQVEVVNEVTNQTVQTTPFLDGTLNVRNLEPGPYRVKVRHPNLVFDVADQRVRVLGDRPTFVPIRIPLDIFQNTPVRDIAEADLAPVRDKLQASSETAGRQARKRGGQPIFADDWNELADIVGDVARATTDLTNLVTPTGHDHPELIEKLDQIQNNLQQFLDVFGRSMAQLQRQIEQFALEQRANDALDQIPDVTPQTRAEVAGIIGELATVQNDNSYVYTSRRKRVGEALSQRLAELVPDDPAVRDHPAVAEFSTTATVLSESLPVSSFDAEVRSQGKVDRETGKTAFTRAIGR